MKRNLLVMLALFAVLFLAGWAQASRPRFEYRTEYKMTDSKMNQLGEEGWELVGFSNTTATMFVFKRAK